MRVHDIFFWAAVFFLVGVLAASVAGAISIAALLIAMTVATLFVASRKYTLLSRGIAMLGLVMVLGAGYYFAFDHFQRDSEIIFGKKVEFNAVILKAEQRLESQKLIVDNIQITVQRYPRFKYGDEVRIVGMIKLPPPEAGNYFAKEGIAGLMSFPEITVLAQNRGSPIKAALFKIKDFFETSFHKVLPAPQAAFLSGLTLGDTARFDDEFKEDMRLSGTSHLVALSGYNIGIIVRSLTLILSGWWLTKRLKFPIATLFVIGFVVMAGAEASVVRAAIMAGLVLLAEKTGRVFYLRNAIAAAALAMILFNPRILVFDAGFQLSFVALLGLTYLRPFLQKWWRIGEEPGFWKWREHFLNTTAAQLAVLPLLLLQFGFFSPLGIISNVLILELIPITMALGFFIGFAAIFSGTLAWVISWPTSVFLAYELGVIHLCAKIINFLI